VVANSETKGSGLSSSTTVDYSFAVIDPGTGKIVGSPYFLGSNTFSGSYPNYLNTSTYTWNTLQMTGVISPTGVFYQGVAGGLFSVQRADKPTLNVSSSFLIRIYSAIISTAIEALGLSVIRQPISAIWNKFF